MRKHLITFIFLITAVAMMSTKCEKEEKTEEPDCKLYEMPSITRDFVIWANIMWMDSVPYTSNVVFNIKKTYCDGTVKGDYSLHEILPDDYGDWFSGMTYTYNFANQRDKITIRLVLYNHSLHEEWTVTHHYFYDDVESMPTLLNLDIILPWNKPIER